MQNQLIKQENNQLAQRSTPEASSAELIQCLIKLETNDRSEAKMELVARTSDLMPAGKPDFLSIPKYPAIAGLIQTEGRKKMLAVMVLMVKDFCSSMNVVRNMNEDQMIEAGAMLLEECGNFRMEDYVMMFSLGKKGQLVKIYDRIDLQVITEMMDEYWTRRNTFGKQLQEEEFKKTESSSGSYILGEWVDPTQRSSRQEESMAQLTAKLAIANLKKGE